MNDSYRCYNKKDYIDRDLHTDGDQKEYDVSMRRVFCEKNIKI